MNEDDTSFVRLAAYRLKELREDAVAQQCFEGAQLIRRAEERLNGESPQWISVSERLPEAHTLVLVTAAGKVRIACYCGDFAGKPRWECWPRPEPGSDLPSIVKCFEITHYWMPLPEPPKSAEPPDYKAAWEQLERDLRDHAKDSLAYRAVLDHMKCLTHGDPTELKPPKAEPASDDSFLFTPPLIF